MLLCVTFPAPYKCSPKFFPRCTNRHYPNKATAHTTSIPIPTPSTCLFFISLHILSCMTKLSPGCSGTVSLMVEFFFFTFSIKCLCVCVQNLMLNTHDQFFFSHGITSPLLWGAEWNVCNRFNAVPGILAYRNTLHWEAGMVDATLPSKRLVSQPDEPEPRRQQFFNKKENTLPARQQF